MSCSLGLEAVASACLGFMPITATASDIVVAVSGITSDAGEIGRALFGTPRGFPLDTSAAVTQWRHADRGGVTWNNVRPTLRAPRFEEAVVQLAADATVTVNVRVAQ